MNENYWQRRPWTASRRKLLMNSSAVVTGVAAAATFGCGGDDETPEASPSSDASPNASPTPAASPLPNANLVVGLTSIPNSADPQQNTAWENSRWAQIYAEGLLSVNPAKAEVELTGSLAEKWEVVSPTEFIFQLRRGVKFQDGSEFNADAVKFNFDRWRLRGSTYFKTNWYSTTSNDLSLVDSVDAIDAYTVRFRTKSNYLDLLLRLADKHIGFTHLLSPTAISTGGIDSVNSKPIGTGPFQVSAFEGGNKFEFVPYQGYWGPNKARVAKVALAAFPDANSRFAALQTGTIDFMIDAEPEQQQLAKGEKNIRRIDAPKPIVILHMQLNMRNPQLKDQRVRLALNHAIDRKKIANVLAQGTFAPAFNYLPPAHFAYEADYEPYPYDLKKAKDLLTAAGVGNVSVGDMTGGFATRKPYGVPGPLIAQAVQENLKQIGLSSTVAKLPYDFARVNAEGLYDENFMCYFTTWGASDAWWLEGLLGSASQAPNGINRTFYSNAAFDDAARKAREATDQPTQKELLKKAHRIAAEDAAWAPIGYIGNAVLLSDKLQGMQTYKGPFYEALETAYKTA